MSDLLPILKPIVYSPRRYGQFIDWIKRNGTKSSPRGQKTIEVVNAHLIVRDPRDRLIFDPARKMNFGFAIAEWIEIITGNNNLEALTRFVPGMAKFSEDGKTVGGAYGPRIKTPSFNQIEEVIKRLKNDPDSRQGIISIYRSDDLANRPHLVPCTISLQFLVRNEKLHLITTMRSNDAVWGLTYDLFTFSMIQEYISVRLGIPLGSYMHNAGSLHIYTDRDMDIINSLNYDRDGIKMREMPEIDLDLLYHSVLAAGDLESRRIWMLFESCSEYERNLVLACRYFIARKASDYYEAKHAYDNISDPAFRKALRIWPL